MVNIEAPNVDSSSAAALGLYGFEIGDRAQCCTLRSLHSHCIVMKNCFRCSWQQESSLCFTGRPSTPDCNNDPSGLGLGDNRTGTTRIATVARGVPQSSKIVGFAVENAEVRRAQVQTPSARFRENEVHQQSPSSPNFCSGFKRLITMQETLTKSFSITFLSLAA